MTHPPASAGPPHPDNRLDRAASLYLRQHAHQPVPWREWGPEALQEAARRDVPVLLSSGYSSCHWCHVMAHESFDDPDVGRRLGELFVCVKVDREERPDVDAVCMDAVQLLHGHGGWPLTAFLLPDGRPFWGGTYFPRHARGGMPGVLDVAEGIAQAWKQERENVQQSAAQLEQAVSRGLSGAFALPPAPDRSHAVEPPPHESVDHAVGMALARADLEHGGFERAPKFPPPMTIELLLRRLCPRRGDEVPAAISRTLDAMLHGGIYDQLAGGFHRYSVDALWLVPHFEKMLYDNAQLLRTYALAWRVTRHPRYERTVRETFAFLRRDLAVPGGAYGSALDADTEGHEGTTYTWTIEQLEAELGAQDAARVARLLQADATGGNFEGTNVLSLAAEPDDATWSWWQPLRERLLAARSLRAQPAFDQKVVAAWNGLLLGALVDAWLALGEGDTVDELLVAALELARHLSEVQVDEEGLLRRTWHPDGTLGAPAFAEDVADVAWGMLRLASATGDPRWYAEGERLARQLLEEFDDLEHGGVFSTCSWHGDTLARHKQIGDHPVPSPTSMAATVWSEMARWNPEEPRWRDRAAAALRSVGRGLAEQPTHLAQAAIALDTLAGAAGELVVVAPAGTPPGRALREAAEPFLPDPARGLYPHLLVAFGREGDSHPGLTGRPAVDGAVTAYLCEGTTCSAPVRDPEAARAMLER